MPTITHEDIDRLDDVDPLKDYRDKFDLPDGVIYMDGNSLGALPKAAMAKMQTTVEQEWGKGLISSWVDAGWVNAPQRIGAKIASCIGAEADEVIVCDSTSVNLFKVLASALQVNAERSVILSEKGNFPTDLYMMQGLEAFTKGAVRTEIVDADSVLDRLDDDVAVLLLTQVHYKTGLIRDMGSVTRKAQAAGALVIWDLSHSAGSIPLDLNACNADFAVGCGYKFLNGGPGAPAFLFAAKRHSEKSQPILSGWFGHTKPFDFSDTYAPANGARRYLCGTPSPISLAALEVGIDIFCEIDMAVLRNKACKLSALFIKLLDERCAPYGFEIISPRKDALRGGHVSFTHEEGYAVMQAVKERGLVGDFRAPNVLRFGITPLYQSYGDIFKAVAIIESVMQSRAWDREDYKQRAAVT